MPSFLGLQISLLGLSMTRVIFVSLVSADFFPLWHDSSKLGNAKNRRALFPSSKKNSKLRGKISPEESAKRNEKSKFHTEKGEPWF